MSARWLQEHFAFGPDQGTFDYYGPLNTLALNIGYHNEHHDFHEIPWTRLPQLKAMAPEFYDDLRCHRSWMALLVTFIFDPTYSLGTRSENVDAGGGARSACRSAGGVSHDAGRKNGSARRFAAPLRERSSRQAVARASSDAGDRLCPIILGLVIYSLTFNSLTLVLLGLVVGYLGWTLTEYFGHRYLFHTVFALPFGLGPRFQFLIHGVHHIYPNDPLRLVMPPLLSAPIMLIALTICARCSSARHSPGRCSPASSPAM